ncbi:unnamed protein product [Cladocopium goreaui]|uniref:Chaperone protein DnaJ n=1 Tax=Cladocopium goreaui TaxID=2562237 RepID=A0A9P1CY79_9DINO|nr:unnamed protein product [Cladocopium goreaui]CAI3998456.1 unnamed protein product [Cladocopium goreaui]
MPENKKNLRCQQRRREKRALQRDVEQRCQQNMDLERRVTRSESENMDLERKVKRREREIEMVRDEARDKTIESLELQRRLDANQKQQQIGRALELINAEQQVAELQLRVQKQEFEKASLRGKVEEFAYETTVLRAAEKSRKTSTGSTAKLQLNARGRGEYDISDADIQNFYNSLRTGAGGDPRKGTVLNELIVKFFYGDFTPQGFKRYSGLWTGPPYGKKDIAVAVAKLKEQMANPMFVTKGGVGYGVDETQKVEDDGKGWVWLAAEMSSGGLVVELFKSVPYGKRAILVAKQSNVDELFQKVNWDTALANSEVTLGGPQVKQRSVDSR